MSDRGALERALSTILEPLGVRALGHDQKVSVNPDREGFRIRLALPPMHVDVEIDQLEMIGSAGLMRVVDKIDRSARVLLAGVVDHIAKHDRSPLDRTKDLEAAATALLDAMRIHLEDIRMPHGSSSAVLDAAYKLRELLRSKAGAASWRRNGYGEHPPEVKTAP